jgi:predicted TIM-barrel fold metal-dependent hydrolase
MCSYYAIGADHILFAVDFPPESNKEADSFIESAPTSAGYKEKIYHLNAEKLFHI